MAENQAIPAVHHEITVIMGYDTMIPLKGPDAGKKATRPFTDNWAKRSTGWQLIARQATNSRSALSSLGRARRHQGGRFGCVFRGLFRSRQTVCDSA